MKNRWIKHEMDSVFVLLLFTLFAGCVLMVLLLGASSYEGVVVRDGQAYDARTGVQYIAAKLRHGDEAGCVQVGSYADRLDVTADDITTLYLKLSSVGEPFYTKIYYYDGYIRELLCPDQIALDPEAGQEVLAATSFSVEQQGSLIYVVIGEEDGETQSICLSVRSDEEGQE